MIPSSKIVWFPHSARYILPIHDSPIYKILVTGRVNKKTYPNRYNILKLSKKNNFIHYQKPELNGYRANNEEDIKTRIYGKKFYSLINNYLISFVCDANESRPYILAKNFEILGSGSLLFACNPNTKKDFETLGFIDGEDYISCTPENMENKIEWLMDNGNLEKIKKIRKNGHAKVAKNHIWEKRTEFLNSILK